jgi:perosamine synthetase
MKVPLFRPFGAAAAAEQVREALASGWWGRGPQVAAFEAELAEYWGCQRERVIATNSGTAALLLACMSVAEEGARVQAPTLTFAATALAPRWAGLTCRLSDVRQDTLCMDHDDYHASWPDVVIPVHFGGHRCGAVDPKFKGHVINDCAHAMSAVAPEPTPRRWWAYSFHAVKNLACGEGGALVAPSEYADFARRLAWCGISKGTAERVTASGYSWDYEINELGQKLHMGDIAAAVGRSQLRLLPAMQARRAEIAMRYRTALDGAQVVDADGICIPVQVWPDMPNHANHLAWIQTLGRDQLQVFLSERGIETGVHYRPLHHHLAFRHWGCGARADAAFRRLLTLPMHPGLTDEQVQYVCDNLKQWYHL